MICIYPWQWQYVLTVCVSCLCDNDLHWSKGLAYVLIYISHWYVYCDVTFLIREAHGDLMNQFWKGIKIHNAVCSPKLYIWWDLRYWRFKRSFTQPKLSDRETFLTLFRFHFSCHSRPFWSAPNKTKSVKSICDTMVTVGWVLCFSRDRAIVRVIVSTGALQTWMWAPNCGGSAGIHCVPSFILAQVNMQAQNSAHNLTRDQTRNIPTYIPPSDRLFF
jgi:hypothetical protein